MAADTDIASVDIAAALSALAHPIRRRIIAELAPGREYVSELARRLRMNRPLLHLHLRHLELAGLVASSLELSTDGKAMRYYVVAPFDIHLTPRTVAAAAQSDRADQPERNRGGPDA